MKDNLKHCESIMKGNLKHCESIMKDNLKHFGVSVKSAVTAMYESSNASEKAINGLEYTVNKKFSHTEAFLLMKYECEVCEETELIWNSRDGVVPFAVVCTVCNGSMKHIEWEHDKFTPEYIPPLGSRIFVDWSKDSYTKHYKDFIEKNWNHSEYPINEYCSNKLVALEGFLTDFEPGMPHIEIVKGRKTDVTEDGKWHRMKNNKITMSFSLIGESEIVHVIKISSMDKYVCIPEDFSGINFKKVFYGDKATLENIFGMEL